jgi:hypothetical protein
MVAAALLLQQRGQIVSEKNLKVTDTSKPVGSRKAAFQLVLSSLAEL